MPRPTTASPHTVPEDLLRLAIQATNATERARYARAGLALEEGELDEDTQFLLLRQLYLAQIEQRRFRKATEVARQMVSVSGGTGLRDIAHHDASRALIALGDTSEAVEEQRAAARHAPARRRSFQLWSLATLLHFAGESEGALRALARAERWAQRDLPLLRAHAAYIQLDRGEAPAGLEEIVAGLMRAKCREGYGQFVLGMIHVHMGDARRASMHLRAFLRRNALVDPAKATTLREELRRARTALAAITSD